MARLLLVVTILYVIGFYFVGSALKPGYSQASNFVSEYNATGTPWAHTLTFAGFMVTAVLSSGFLLVSAPIAQLSGASLLGYRLLWSLPASYFVGVLFPCDVGCPAEGSINQSLHNAFALFAYLGMGLGIALVSLAPGFKLFRLRQAFLLTTGMAYPAVFIAMVQPSMAPWRGLLQRSLDIALAISLILLAWTLLVPGGRARSERPVTGREAISNEQRP
ncbi:hypothetical protein CO641_14475 [Lysobacteraceae bacterium NML91-0213]|mgnify:CR=1 FL=1|nr:hypothetical protein CO641_14475 [Xanthomonadaceae bacterium NML91-0213]